MCIKERTKHERHKRLMGKTYIERRELRHSELELILCPVCHTWQRSKHSGGLTKFCPKCKANGVDTPFT